MNIECDNAYEAQNLKLTKQLGYWTLAWLISLAIATFGPLSLWEGHTNLSIIAIGLNLAVGIGMILANKRHLKAMDELQQKIQLEAMGITLGITLVVGLAYSVLDTANVIAFDAEISHLITIMGLTYGVATVAGHRRYL